MKTTFGKEAKQGDYVIATITEDDGWQKYGISLLGRVSNGKVFTTKHGVTSEVATIVVDKALVSESDKKLIAQNIEDFDFIKSQRSWNRLSRLCKKESRGNCEKEELVKTDIKIASDMLVGAVITDVDVNRAGWQPQILAEKNGCTYQICTSTNGKVQITGLAEEAKN